MLSKSFRQANKFATCRLVIIFTSTFTPLHELAKTVQHLTTMRIMAEQI